MFPASLHVPTDRRDSIKVADIQPTDSHTGSRSDRFAAKKGFFTPENELLGRQKAPLGEPSPCRNGIFALKIHKCMPQKKAPTTRENTQNRHIPYPEEGFLRGKNNCNSPNNWRETGFPIARIHLNFSLREEDGAGEIFQFQLFQLNFKGWQFPFIYIYLFNI